MLQSGEDFTRRDVIWVVLGVAEMGFYAEKSVVSCFSRHTLRL